MKSSAPEICVRNGLAHDVFPNAENERVRQLEDDLRIARDAVRASMLRQAAIGGELRISNEQAMAINDALQSSSEQLERSQDELHNLNEALTTANRQLQQKVAALEASAATQRELANSLEARVRERTAQLRSLTTELALTSERERRLLAQDLHDGLGQLLAIVKIKLTSIKGRERRGRVRGALKDIEGLVDQSNQSVRTLMLELSPPVLYALGLVPALEWLAEEMKRVYGLVVNIETHGPRIMLDEPAKTTIFRAVRELLINVSKHAGCNVARMRCLSSADSITISVSDDGDGFTFDEFMVHRTGDIGFGLVSLKDRIEFIGGEMRVDTAPGCGTTVTIIFPSRHPDKSAERSQGKK